MPGSTLASWQGPAPQGQGWHAWLVVSNHPVPRLPDRDPGTKQTKEHLAEAGNFLSFCRGQRQVEGVTASYSPNCSTADGQESSRRWSTFLGPCNHMGDLEEARGGKKKRKKKKESKQKEKAPGSQLQPLQPFSEGTRRWNISLSLLFSSVSLPFK